MYFFEIQTVVYYKHQSNLEYIRHYLVFITIRVYLFKFETLGTRRQAFVLNKKTNFNLTTFYYGLHYR